MRLEDLVHNWLLGGADPEVGLRLFLDYTEPHKSVARILSKAPDRHLQIIRSALLIKIGLSADFAVSQLPPAKIINNTPVKKLRSDWPFLSDPNCPPELKLLISEKITAYTSCVQHYNALDTCTTNEDQLSTVRSLVHNFINNHNIFRELKHYKDHGKVLGEHKIFVQYQRIKDLRNQNTMSLVKIKKNLEFSIWRNERNIKKQKRADLLESRQEKIKDLKMQLAEVDRLLE